MTHQEARRVLDAVRCNEAAGIPVDAITEALETLGDLPTSRDQSHNPANRRQSNECKRAKEPDIG